MLTLLSTVASDESYRCVLDSHVDRLSIALPARMAHLRYGALLVGSGRGLCRNHVFHQGDYDKIGRTTWDYSPRDIESRCMFLTKLLCSYRGCHLCLPLFCHAFGEEAQF